MYRMITVFTVTALLLGGCETRKTEEGGKAQRQEMQATEANQQRLLRAVPPPKLKTSLEREQLKRRLERFNVADKISYIYLLSRYGTVVAFHTIKGKVSSVNSLLTTPDQVLEVPTRGQGPNPAVVISSPDLDGSYGSNGNAIFFFTTEDVYVEWSGEYYLADQPLQLTTKPLLMRDVTPKALKR